jgi:hypothetical protein
VEIAITRCGSASIRTCSPPTSTVRGKLSADDAVALGVVAGAPQAASAASASPAIRIGGFLTQSSSDGSRWAGGARVDGERGDDERVGVGVGARTP